MFKIFLVLTKTYCSNTSAHIYTLTWRSPLVDQTCNSLQRETVELFWNWCLKTIFSDCLFQRKSRYFVINAIVPCYLMTSLGILVFFIPSESGEKISFAMSILIAFSVFQMTIHGNMPKTSLRIPYIGIGISILWWVKHSTLELINNYSSRNKIN